MSGEDDLQADVARLRAAGCVRAEDEAVLLRAAADDRAAVAALITRRVAGEPLEYLLGWAGFRGRRYRVSAGVFVPRHRSDLLVDTALAVVRPGAVLLDLCCGCGALAAAVREECGVPVEVHAADIDAAAVECARTNLADARVYQGDLFAALPAALAGRVAVLVANAPYVPTGELALLPAEARDHENPRALDGGADGTAVQQRVLREAPAWLAPGGVVLTETSRRQAGLLVDAARAAGLSARVVRDEDATVVAAARKSIS